MKIIKRQVKDQPLTVIVEYPEYDASVERVVRGLERLNVHFKGKLEEKTVSVDAMEVYFWKALSGRYFFMRRSRCTAMTEIWRSWTQT